MRHPTLSSLVLASTFAVAAAAQCSDPSGGTQQFVTDDSTTVWNNSFAFPFPGGVSATGLEIDSNGRIYPSGSGDATDPGPSVAELLDDPHPTLALAWGDHDPSSFGDVFVTDNGVDQTLVFWDETSWWLGAAEFDMWAELNADGSFAFVYDLRAAPSSFGMLIGISPGFGHPDPGPSDISSFKGAGATDTGSNPALYEQFSGSLDNDLAGFRVDFFPNSTGGYFVVASDCDFARADPVGPSCDYGTAGSPMSAIYGPSNVPVVGTVFTTQAFGIPSSATAGFVLVGTIPFQAPNYAPLNLVWNAVPASCVLTHQVDLFSAPLTGAEYTPGAATATYAIDLTAAPPSAVGFPVKLQLVFQDPTVPWAAQIDLLTTNGIESVFGI